MLVGIPHYNDEENLYQVIESFIKSTNSYSVITVMNADERLDNQKLIDAFGNIEIINIENKGPLYAYNQLFKLAEERKEDLFLTQTDVYFPSCKKDWLNDMIEISKQPNCGMITCWGGGGTSGPDFINGFNWVGAWCTYIPYRTIEKLGGYDENIPIGYGVDIDYTYAAVKAGLQIYMIDYWVHHFPNYKDNHQHEHVENFEELKQQAFAYMREKWQIK